MINRKINVEKLSDEQLKKAEEVISDKINSEILKFTNYWNSILREFDCQIKLEVVLDTEDKVNILDKTFSEIPVEQDSSEDLKEKAQRLNRISKQMTEELTKSIESCNSLLSRYGMACDMGVVYSS
jgi:cell fate (sporulation/competence/biofilm development) regulator YmcA (YheA/YmcA/DUF963 family)